MTPTTNRLLYESIKSALGRLERHLDAIDGTEWRHDMARTLGDANAMLNSFANFADAGGYKPLELDNGASIERFKWIEPQPTPSTRPWGIVLAKARSGWVTWRFTQEKDGSIKCDDGHYFREDRREADDDYDDRVRGAHLEAARRARR